MGYFATVQMGTPPRDFRLIMDSGSADLWVGAEKCVNVNSQGLSCVSRSHPPVIPSSIAADAMQWTQGVHQFLGANSSSTFVDTKKAFQVTYGSGAVGGTIVTDTLIVAGLTLTNHTFGAANEETVQFAGDPNTDGLMGLAQSVRLRSLLLFAVVRRGLMAAQTLSNEGVLTPPEAMAKAGIISQAVVSYKISRLQDGKNDGQVTFGGIDEVMRPASALCLSSR